MKLWLPNRRLLLPPRLDPRRQFIRPTRRQRFRPAARPTLPLPMFLQHLKYSAGGHLMYSASGHLVNDCASVTTCTECGGNPTPTGISASITGLSICGCNNIASNSVDFFGSAPNGTYDMTQDLDINPDGCAYSVEIPLSVGFNTYVGNDCPSSGDPPTNLITWEASTSQLQVHIDSGYVHWEAEFENTYNSFGSLGTPELWFFVDTTLDGPHATPSCVNPFSLPSGAEVACPGDFSAFVSPWTWGDLTFTP